MPEYLVRTFYKFQELEESQLPELQEKYYREGAKRAILGSILLSTEGCNATIAGQAEELETFFEILRQDFPDIPYQDSFSEKQPFKRFKVPLKKQIVQARDSELIPSKNFSGQMSPQEWDEIREQVRSGQAQMVDVRNDYEIEIGTFPEATNPETNTFKEFSDYLDREVGQTLDPQKPTAIFCTGGIRCEKARLDLERRGFSEVLQLKGGILTYLKDSAEKGFEGECFVFDERVAVDGSLKPSQKYSLCPKCGGPKSESGVEHDCKKGRKVP